MTLYLLLQVAQTLESTDSQAKLYQGFGNPLSNNISDEELYCITHQ